MKILIIQTAFLGDVILTTPLLRKVFETFPGAEIYFLTTPEGAEILKNNPLLTEILIFDKHNTERTIPDLLRKIKELKKYKFDMVFLPHRSFRSSLLAYLSRVPIRIGFSRSSGSYFLTKRVKREQDKHELERNINLLEGISINTEPTSPELYPTKEDFKYVKNELKDVFDSKFGWRVVFAPGSHWATKRYPRIYFAEVGKLLLDDGIKNIILMGGKEDRFICEDIKNRIGPKAVNVAGKFSPLQSLAMLNLSSLLISNDSAPLHMASAIALPTVAIFGPTTPQFGFGPWGKLVKVIEVNLDCRPCSPHGPRVCPLGHHMCMKNISPHEVADAALTLLIKRFWYMRIQPEIFRFPLMTDD